MTAWLVFYVRGARFGSVPLTRDNLARAHEAMNLALIARDVTGTEHYAVLAVR